jgi:hypothetical protein
VLGPSLRRAVGRELAELPRAVPEVLRPSGERGRLAPLAVVRVLEVPVGRRWPD